MAMCVRRGLTSYLQSVERMGAKDRNTSLSTQKYKPNN